MNRYRAFNFGPELGPLNNAGEPAPHGKLVWVPATPLRRGHWGLASELIGVDEPIGEEPDGAGGGGGSGGGGVPTGPGIMGGGGTWRLLGMGLYTPPKENGVPYRWAKCENGRDCCSAEQKERIKNAYKRLVTLKCLVDQFPSLFAEIKNAYKSKVKIRCVPLPCTLRGTRFRSYHHFNDEDPNDPANNEIWICESTVDKMDDPDDLVSALLHELIHAVNGIELDALAIIKVCWPKTPYEVVEMYNAELRSQGCVRVLPNGKTLIFGRYVAWDPETGEIASLLEPGNTQDENRHSRIISGDKDWIRSQSWITEATMIACIP